MGAWGHGIFQNDDAYDVIDEFFDMYDDGIEYPQIIETLEKSTPIEETSQWLALAKLEWDLGILSENTRKKLEESIEYERKNNIDTWKDPKKRGAVMQNLLETIQKENKNTLQINRHPPDTGEGRSADEYYKSLTDEGLLETISRGVDKN